MRMHALILMLCSLPVLAAPPVYVCWDGSLVKTPRKCPVYRPPIICLDGTIVTTAAECPPVIVCPDGSLSSGGSCPPPPTPDSTFK